MTRFDRLKQNKDSEINTNSEIKNYKGKKFNKQFDIGEEVYIRDYSKPNQRGWKACTVPSRTIRSISLFLCRSNK